MRRDILPLLFFVLSLLLSVGRSYDPYLFEEDLGEGFLILRIEGEHRLEENRLLSKVKVLGGDFPEIYGKRAIFTVYGTLDLHSRYIKAYAKVKVLKGRIYISSSYKDVSFIDSKPSIRDRMIKRVESKIMDPAIRSLVLTYFLGEDQELLPLKVQSAFLTTGLIHLLVVSGGHLTTLALILRYLAPYRYGLLLSLAGITLYSLFLVPSEPPILRAYLMAVFVIFLLFYGERPNLLGILLFSGAFILLFYPEYVSSYSFWLSFCATLYIVLSLRDAPKKGLVFLSFWVSFFAFLGTMPIISLLSFSAPFSIILTPLLTPLFGFFTVYGFLDMLTFFSLPSLPLELLGQLIINSILFFSHLAPTVFFNFSLWETVLSLVLGAFILYLLRGWKKLLAGAVFVPFLL
ncbi:ComEC/Rec2 family competence protein [Thermocrinis sp.]